MRIMIYLRTKEDTSQTAGYLRLERKGGYLFFSLVLTGTVVPAGCPIYIVYDKDDRQQRYCIGYTGETENSEGRILLSQLPHRECETKVYGALVGTEESYLTGTVNSQFELPVWQQEAPPEEEIVPEKTPLEEETVPEEAPPVRECTGAGNAAGKRECAGAGNATGGRNHAGKDDAGRGTAGNGNASRGGIPAGAGNAAKGRFAGASHF